jgi:DNA-binding transcriptional LysR family regulator
MRLRHIEVFFAIWRNGSVTGAADELAISQSSVSKTLKHAEQNLGFELFHRVRGKLILSEEGETLLNDAASINEGLETMRLRAASLRNGLSRPIRIVCLPSLGQWPIPQSVVNFHKSHPKVTLEISTKHEREMLDGLRTREFDLAFTFGPLHEAPHLPGLIDLRP